MDFPDLCLSYMANGGGLASTANLCRAARFRAKHALGLDPGVGTGSREENASKQLGLIGPDFDQNRSGSRQGRL
jgi:hypothetical protein